MGGGKSKPELFSSPPPSEDTNAIQTHENKFEVLLDFSILIIAIFYTIPKYYRVRFFFWQIWNGIAEMFKTPKIANMESQ